MRCHCSKKNDGKGKEWEHKARKAAPGTDLSDKQKSDNSYAPLESPSYESNKFLGQMKALDEEELLERIMDKLGF
jgi:hypothetical protein